MKLYFICEYLINANYVRKIILTPCFESIVTNGLILILRFYHHDKIVKPHFKCGKAIRKIVLYQII